VLAEKICLKNRQVTLAGSENLAMHCFGAQFFKNFQKN
jgi:hypothetical protein